MHVATIIEQLQTVESGLPRAALAAASQERAHLAPQFITEFERFTDNAAVDQAEADKLFFKFYLLAEWRVTAAYRPLCRFLRAPSDKIATVLGDGLTETAHRVIAAVFDGDLQPILDVITDPKADQYVRSNLCDLLAHLVLNGQVERAPIVGFLRDGFATLQPQAESFMWFGWQTAIAKLGLAEMHPMVKMAFDREFIDSGTCGFQHFENELSAAGNPQQQAKWRNDPHFAPFGNTIDELSTWHCFDEAARRRELRVAKKAAAQLLRTSIGKVGRNDPCPCGSGKKFKKCCLN